VEEKDKLCCLTLDEMEIKPRTEYDSGSKTVLGDVTLPNHDGGSANHAFVFMLGVYMSNLDQRMVGTP
jgi:hypothetical protein